RIAGKPDVIMLSEQPLRQASTSRARRAAPLVLRMAALLLAIVAGAAAALAGSPPNSPPKGVFIYTISRNGDPVGQQRLEFVGDGERLRVLSHTSLDVSFLGMDLYGFEQQVEEVHQGDR